MKAYNFSFPQKGPDLHAAFFDQLKAKQNTDFDTQNPTASKVIFHGIENEIMARSAVKPNGLKSQEEILLVEVGDKIKGIVTLCRLKQCYLTKPEIEAFIQKKGREPNSKELYSYRTLQGELLENYLTGLFQKAGMQLDHFIDLDSGTRYFTKTNTTFNSMDIVFEAKIIDLEAFEHAWFNGVGRYKTMGFGMLRVVKR